MAIYRGSESTGTATQVFNIDGDKGDITVTNGGDTWTIDVGVVTTTKLGGDITPQGKALLDDATASDQRTTLGLGTAAVASTTDFATAAQGVLADSAVQPLDSVTLADVVVDSLQVSGSGNTAGTFTWNDTDGTLDLILKGEDVTLQVGQEHVVRVTNTTGSTLVDGQVVYVLGSTGNHLDVGLAQANSEVTSSKTLAIVTESIADNQSGFATVLGLVRDLNTSAFAEGAALWLSPSVAGAITTTRPTAPNNSVFLGWCVRQHASVGSIFVNIQNGYELEEIHDVLMGAKLAGQTLIYDATVGVWKNARLTAGTGVTITNGDGTITIASTAGGISDGDKGDITVSSSGTVWTIDNGAVSLAKTTGVAASGANSDITSLSGLSGNVSFTGTGNRITGDFSNATQTNRVAFQSSTTNGATAVNALPNGTSRVSTYQAYDNTDPTNSSYIGIVANGTNGITVLESSIRGTGTYLPMTFYTGGSERVRIDTSGNVGIGVTSTGGYKVAVGGSGLKNQFITTDANNAYLYTDGGAYIGSTGAFVTTFVTNNTERFRISADGAIGLSGANYGTASTQAIVSNGSAAAPTWQTVLTPSTGVSSFSAGTTGLTPSTGTTGAVTLAGTLAIANGGTGATSAPTARTNLGATTVGSNVFTLTNPSAITFPRFNADNTVSALIASDFRTAIGAGTGNGTVTSVSWTGGIVSVATGTTTPAFTIAGTSGGIPYFSSASTWATSAALAANALVVGGGAGVAPSTVTTGTGVVTALGVAANGSGGFVTDTGSVTLTNKTVNLTSNTLSGTKAQFDTALSDDNFGYVGTANSWTQQQTFKELKDTVFTITDAAGFQIDPANGSIQTITLGANRTPVATNFEAGQCVLLGIDDGTAFTITWTSIPVTWVKAGGTASAPTLATTGFTWVLLWEVGTTIYGVEVGKP